MNSILTPYQMVTAHYELPFELFPFQVEAVNELAPLPKSGFWFDPGLGKTSTATVAALYKMLMDEADQVIVIVPPMVINTWDRWLKQLPVSRTIYRGTPAERKTLQLKSDFIVVGIQIFKKDYARFAKELGDKRVIGLVDEAHGLKNTASDNYRKVSAFFAEKPLMLLTGTPVSSPRDVYAYSRLLATGVYRSLGHFDNLHVKDRDFFGNVSAWKNLDILADNLRINAKRVLKEEALLDLPEITYTPLYYDLDPAHLRLYRTLAEQQILQLESGGKIDATNSSALYNKLQQIVANWDYFSSDPKNVSNSLRMVDQVLDEIGDRKLILFAQYRMTNRKLLEYCQPYGAVASFGDQTPLQNSRAIDQFVDDPNTRIIVMQPESGGVGVDGLQAVCSDAFFVETPVVPRNFHQAVARIHRKGQPHNVNVRIGIAEKTIQHRLHHNLMANDKMVNLVAGGFQDLREALYGN